MGDIVGILEGWEVDVLGRFDGVLVEGDEVGIAVVGSREGVSDFEGCFEGSVWVGAKVGISLGSEVVGGSVG